MARVIRLSSVQQFAAVDLTDPGYHHGPKLIPNACQVRLNWSLNDGLVAHNVLYAQYAGSPALSVTLANQIATAITGGIRWTTLAGFLAPGASFTGVTLTDVRSIVGLEISSDVAAIPGQSASGAIPDESAVVVTLRTEQRGKSGRGRAYIPGFAENAVGPGGTISDAAVAAVEDWFRNNVALQIGSVLGALVLGLPEREAYTSPVTGAEFEHRDATTLLIQTMEVRDNHWDSQRRRGLK